VNSKHGPEWKIWEQPDDYVSYGIPAFRGAEAARRQGDKAFNLFHEALLISRHEERKDISSTRTLIAVAESVNLDLTRFQADIRDPHILDKLASDHTGAVNRLGVFGTPTLVFPGNQAVFLKMAEPPPVDKSIELLTEIRSLIEQRPYVLEIKRPEKRGG